MDALAAYLETAILPQTPLIIAGDFNDWRNEADTLLAKRLDMTEVFGGLGGLGGLGGSPGRSYPAKLPVLRLDRIYVRGFSVEQATVHFEDPWAKISDHAALSARLRLI